MNASISADRNLSEQLIWAKNFSANCDLFADDFPQFVNLVRTSYVRDEIASFFSIQPSEIRPWNVGDYKEFCRQTLKMALGIERTKGWVLTNVTGHELAYVGKLISLAALHCSISLDTTLAKNWIMEARSALWEINAKLDPQRFYLSLANVLGGGAELVKAPDCTP